MCCRPKDSLGGDKNAIKMVAKEMFFLIVETLLFDKIKSRMIFVSFYFAFQEFQ
jgi:hypothetical protein